MGVLIWLLFALLFMAALCLLEALCGIFARIAESAAVREWLRCALWNLSYAEVCIRKAMRPFFTRRFSYTKNCGKWR